MGIFGDYEVRIDPWEVSEGSEFLFDPEQRDTKDEVNPEVELPVEEWAPVSPTDEELPSTLYFIDGVRRLEARVLINHETGLSYGAFGSYGVGAVKVYDKTAEYDQYRVGRLIASGSGRILPQPVNLGPSLNYLPVSATGADPDSPLKAIQAQMRHAEENLATEFEQEDSLVILDGPLNFQSRRSSAMIGLIKRIHQLYLDTELLKAVSQLKAGQRTPIFAISHMPFARYSWFLRLAQPRILDSDFAGIVRLEVSDTVGLPDAIRLANATARGLPKFAPGRGRDPRAPQNLLPVGALEDRLRRQLGHRDLVRRKIEVLIAKEASNG